MGEVQSRNRKERIIYYISLSNGIHNMQEQIRQLVLDVKSRWDAQKSAKGSWLISNSRFSVAVPFFLKVIDELMVFANTQEVAGIVKKTSVMVAISDLYDYIVSPLLPIYLKPFSSKIKELVVDTMISYLIDFLVAKVKSVKAS